MSLLVIAIIFRFALVSCFVLDYSLICTNDYNLVMGAGSYDNIDGINVRSNFEYYLPVSSTSTLVCMQYARTYLLGPVYVRYGPVLFACVEDLPGDPIVSSKMLAASFVLNSAGEGGTLTFGYMSTTMYGLPISINRVFGCADIKVSIQYSSSAQGTPLPIPGRAGIVNYNGIYSTTMYRSGFGDTGDSSNSYTDVYYPKLSNELGLIMVATETHVYMYQLPVVLNSTAVDTLVLSYNEVNLNVHSSVTCQDYDCIEL